jgi:urease accessory protein
MAHAASLLRLMWLASPALPVGGFSYSEALEAAVEAGHVTNETQAGDWLLDQLHLSLARADLAIAAEAFDAWQQGDLARVQTLNDWIHATRETAELRLQTEQMGRSLVEWLRTASRPTTPASPRSPPLRRRQPGRWPLRWPRRTRGRIAGCSARARLRLGREHGAGGDEGRAAGPDRRPAHAGAALAADSCRCRTSLDLPARRAPGLAPMLAILSAQHETQYSRLFRS